MSSICARCGTVFPTHKEYSAHKCEVELKPERDVLDPKPTTHVDVGAQVKTKGLPIQERLQKLCPDDRTGHIHESMTVFQSLAMHLAGRTHVEEKVFLAAVDVRCLILGLHALCDRIEGESVP